MKSNLDPQEWIEKYGDDLYRYAMFRVRNPEIAEEVVQETFLAALKGKESFSGRSSEKTWLFGILKHKIVDSIRKSTRDRKQASFDAAEGSVDDFFDPKNHWKSGPASWEANPDEIVEKKEFLEVLETCLTHLPERLARAFSLREMEALESEEICKILGISATNLGVMLHRARARLRHCLEVNWFTGEGEKKP
ncbi:MAG: sigma-70 family RNA polymerase sigma factor [Planctomycetota bacterium]